MTMLVRVQDANGRGPWMPGFSSTWTNPNRIRFLPPIYAEIGMNRLRLISKKAHADGLHIGCAVPPKKLADWFDAYEREKLLSSGYRLVDCSDCQQLASTATQKLIASPFPLSQLPMIDWPASLQNRQI